MTCVRFAPSPTGFLHIGGIRTALFNFLYARNQQGKFLLRIEDTDRERSQAVYEREILDSLEWLGLRWDEEIVYQSSRLNRYQEVAENLMADGLAYDEIKEGKRAVRFRVPKRPIFFQDMIHGRMQFDASLFDDLVILKSDGYPTYHFACVIDDHDMGITHVIRGDDHLSNTPKQLLLLEALGWKPPKYAHVPLILGEDGSPLSKRHGAVSVKWYQEEGYLPEGVLNYLALLGWGMEGNQEIFSLDELIKKFSVKRIHKSGACFDFEKLAWLNGQHIRKLSEEDYLSRVSAYYGEESRCFSPRIWKRLALLYQSRIRTFSELKAQADYLFAEIEVYERDIFLQLADSEDRTKLLRKGMEAWGRKAETLSDFEDETTLEKMTREVAAESGMEAKALIHPLRFALTAKTSSPGLFELMAVLGKEKCLARLKRFLAVDTLWT